MTRTGLRTGIALGVLGLLLGVGIRGAEAAPYGVAGCGLGSVIFGSGGGSTQITAATTNGTLCNQTWGISSGTSNCVNVEPSAASTKAFIETNREAVAKDISRGSGETIASLSTVAGCSDARAVGATLQREFKSIFPNAKVSDTAVSGAVIRTLKSHKHLGCKHLIDSGSAAKSGSRQAKSQRGARSAAL
jgi:hypothetical protein